MDLERLERVERQLVLLWERVQQDNEKQEQRHGDVLGLYGILKEQLHTQTDRESLGVWVSSLLEQRLGVLRGELEQERALTAQVGRAHIGSYQGIFFASKMYTKCLFSCRMWISRK